MQVRPSGSPGGAYFSQNAANADRITRLYVERTKVSVESVDAQSVIHDHGISRKVQRLGKYHAAALCRVHRRARRRREIYTRVG